MNDIDIFKEKAENGYTFCFADKCPLKERCLHYLVGQQMSKKKPKMAILFVSQTSVH